tara:strand:- start:331 stop:564 length:234 start_codon:yes stop_codon:yes gene_type:complete
MQKVFNALSLVSFCISAGLLGSSIMIYSRLPGMITRWSESVTGNVTGKVTEMLPEQIEEVMPELPTMTGPAIPFKMP